MDIEEHVQAPMWPIQAVIDEYHRHSIVVSYASLAIFMLFIQSPSASFAAVALNSFQMFLYAHQTSAGFSSFFFEHRHVTRERLLRP
jgi:hypothetical protein